MVKKKSKKETKKVIKKESKEKVQPLKKYDGPTKSFRFRNPEGHADKYNWITLQKGNSIPKEIQPILDKEEKTQKLKDRVNKLRDDLADDGKENRSIQKEKSLGKKK